MSQRTIPWGTVLAGATALGTAVLIGLTEVAGLNITLRGAGPGTVVVIGLLILVAGLVVVLRSGRAARTAASETAPSPVQETARPSSTPSGPLDVTEPTPIASPDTPAATRPDTEPAQSSH